MVQNTTMQDSTRTIRFQALPDEEDWKKTVPTEDELKDKTVREQIVMIAQSQKGCKESELS